MASRLDRAGVRWWVAGGVAAWLHGSPRRPGDLDVECVAADAPAAARALGVVLAPETDARASSLRGGRTMAGIWVDLSVGLRVSGPRGTVAPDDRAVWESTRRVGWEGGAVRVPDPGEAVARAIAWDDPRREARARAVATPVDEAYVRRRLGLPQTAS